MPRKSEQSTTATHGGSSTTSSVSPRSPSAPGPHRTRSGTGPSATTATTRSRSPSPRRRVGRSTTGPRSRSGTTTGSARRAAGTPTRRSERRRRRRRRAVSSWRGMKMAPARVVQRRPRQSAPPPSEQPASPPSRSPRSHRSAAPAEPAARKGPPCRYDATASVTWLCTNDFHDSCFAVDCGCLHHYRGVDHSACSHGTPRDASSKKRAVTRRPR
jgi:hypothetical protein